MAKLKLKKVSSPNNQEATGKSKFSQMTKKEDHSESEAPKTLWDIVDHEQDFHMLYSGVEDERNFDILYDMGIRNFLMSYQYVQNRHMNVDKFSGLGIKFFIDSGAHTYQNDPKYAEYDVEYWEEHLQKYLKWVEKNKDYIFAIANFDFENVVGAEKVKEWNEELMQKAILNLDNESLLKFNELRLFAEYLEKILVKGSIQAHDNDERIINTLIESILHKTDEALTDDDKESLAEIYKLISETQKHDLKIHPIIEELRKKWEDEK